MPPDGCCPLDEGKAELKHLLQHMATEGEWKWALSLDIRSVALVRENASC